MLTGLYINNLAERDGQEPCTRGEWDKWDTKRLVLSVSHYSLTSSAIRDTSA